MGKRRAAGVLRAGLNALVAATLAPSCAACGLLLDTPAEGPVCGTCWNRVPLLSDDVFTTRFITRGRAAGRYDDRLRDIIHAFKYEGRRGLAKPLARLAADSGGDILQGADLIVPVPLHPLKRLRRGFNQADDLAVQFGVGVARVLWRAKLTRSQTGLGAGGRRRNVRGAFRLTPFVSHDKLANAVVVLVDDVRTTGATLDACAKVLLAAGVGEVRALTVARAVIRKGP